MADTEDLELARKNYETAAKSVGKIGYLGGNKNEELFARSYEALASINNKTLDHPHIILPRKRFRR